MEGWTINQEARQIGVMESDSFTISSATRAPFLQFMRFWDRDPQARPVRLQTLIQLRWLAIIGQGLALLFVHFGLGFELPILPALSAVAASVVFNAWLFFGFPASRRLGHGAATGVLIYDLLQLSFLLFLTGGLENPFALFLLAPVVIAAAILRLRHTLALAALALLCLSILGVTHYHLPWSDEGLLLPPLYQTAMFAALAIGMAFLALYVWQVAAEARRMQDALGATQLALARQKQLAAVGGLAAAAAHELGTPLATIALVARELQREVALESAMAEDVALLVSQAQRCGEILKGLGAHSSDDKVAERFSRLPLPTLLEQAASPYRQESPRLVFEADGPGEPPNVSRSAEVLHALGNLIDNALDFAKEEVRLAAAWTDQTITVTIRDDGPGISPDILTALGEPYVTSRPDNGGMGLGVFIAKTLLEQTQARITIDNRRSDGPNNVTGAEITIVWTRRDLEAKF